jgi:hypothetical protein
VLLDRPSLRVLPGPLAHLPAQVVVRGQLRHVVKPLVVPLNQEPVLAVLDEAAVNRVVAGDGRDTASCILQNLDVALGRIEVLRDERGEADVPVNGGIEAGRVLVGRYPVSEDGAVARNLEGGPEVGAADAQIPAGEALQEPAYRVRDDPYVDPVAAAALPADGRPRAVLPLGLRHPGGHAVGQHSHVLIPGLLGHHLSQVRGGHGDQVRYLGHVGNGVLDVAALVEVVRLPVLRRDAEHVVVGLVDEAARRGAGAAPGLQTAVSVEPLPDDDVVALHVPERDRLVALPVARRPEGHLVAMLLQLAQGQLDPVVHAAGAAVVSCENLHVFPT